MSIFSGKRGLRHSFAKLTAAELSAATAATTIGTAKLLHTYKNWGRLSYLDNTLIDGSGNGVDVGLALVHPEADPTDPTFRLFWIELPGLRVLNYSTGDAPGIAFDPGTRLYAWYLSAPASGSVRLAAWG